MIWGLLMAVIGALMFLAARTRSDFVLYRLIAARSRVLWADRVHAFLQVSGILVVLVGVLVATFG